MTFAELKRLWRIEMLGGEERRFSWTRLFRRYRQRSRYRFMFWFRLAQYLYSKPSRFWQQRALRMGDRLAERFGIEIPVTIPIGEGLYIPHLVGIVITRKAVIGKNFSIFQNTTIGQKNDGSRPIVIGDNVSVGANACIIGDGLQIGDNVSIGAAAFVNADVPAGHAYISRHTHGLIPLKQGAFPISTIHTRRARREDEHPDDHSGPHSRRSA
ncbi:serine acetyltransferase [Pseudomonas sp. ZM23]|uniref:Serine acetyltransferase n=1 Tax=Pseudomonas triclosanedens TaxID=2961893 RepID=A0ABY7A616_9PSED|nr:serine acetyltransferase [Pseudomonas triclosanedens]MCP8464900.1 serine acetyltransferase [Pseudomonas triclosanedens]MCP8476193.1 serine acetyltransferase [Pseudomonas triclosanedens]WAI51573.1 serine acetyltransferase [Pseudomonas triclosanedens]